MSAFFMTIAVLLFVVGLSAAVAFLFMQNRKISAAQENISVESVRQIILTKIQDVKELAVVRSNFQSAVTFEDAKKIFGRKLPGTARKFSLSYTGTVVCGCDLNKIRIANSFYNNNHLTVQLPESKILDIYPNVETLEILDNSAGIFADDIKIEEQNRELSADIQKVSERLISEGILIKIDENVRQIIKAIAEPLGIVAEVKFLKSGGQSDLLRLS